MIKRILFCVVLVLTAYSPSIALAAEPANHEGYELRMEFIESRLDENRKHASYWQNGWSSFYAVSALAQAALWIDADDSNDSINYGVGALKSVGGLADILLKPHPSRHGAMPLLALPQNSMEQKREKLDLSEALLRDSAQRAASRHSWQPHVKVVGVNLIAGALIAAFGDGGDALASSAIGIAIGEANIWTQPTRPEDDWRDYQQEFPATGQLKETGWHMVPIAGGLALQKCF
jgi:hypothetical protein